MRRVMAGVSACVLASLAAAPVMAQEPSATPPPWFGGRAEMPEYGIAITLPDTWLGFDLTGDVAAQLRAVTDVMGDVFPESTARTSADLRRRGERYELLALSLDSQSCELEVVWSGGSDPRDPALHGRIDAIFDSEPAFEGYTGVRPIDLPGGAAITYAWVQVAGGTEGQDLPHTSYLIGGPDRDAVLTCEGTDRPTDDWLSIAETFEFLPPVDPASLADPAAPWLGGRVEMQNRGFALELPAGWVGIDTAADLEAQLAAVAASFEPVRCGQCREALHDGLTRMVAAGGALVAIDPMTGSGCGVVLGDDRTGAPLGRYAVGLFEAYSADPRVTDVTPPVEIDLPAGDAIRIGMSTADGTVEGQYLPSTVYLVLADDRYLLASCSAYQRPKDDWLSIAETFEFVGANAGATDAQEPSLAPAEGTRVEQPTPVVGVGGRIELPEAGLAWSFPDDWAWMSYSDLDWEEARSELARSAGDEMADWFEPFYPDLGTRDPLIAQGPDGLCTVHITPSSLSLDEFVPGYLANREAGGLHYDVTRSDIELPAGDAARLDYALVEDSPSHGWIPTDYLLSTGSAMYVIECMGPEGADDDWLSITATFELLPAAE